MRVKALEIRWHNTQPIFSADFHPLPADQYRKTSAHPYMSKDMSPDRDPELCWRLATAGGDNNVRIWLVHPEPRPAPGEAPAATGSSQTGAGIGSPRVEYLATLTKHTAVVNIVRFSPKGDMLASAGDDGAILLWVPAEKSSSSFGNLLSEDSAYERENWRVKTMARSTSTEVYDLAWSPEGDFFITGSTDHTARIYSADNGGCIHQITDHNNYVQGVSWDPLDKYIATQSSDRHMHVYSLKYRKNSSGGRDLAEVHLEGKNSRLDLERAGGLAFADALKKFDRAAGGAPLPTPAPTVASAEDEEHCATSTAFVRPPAPKRTPSQASERSESSSRPDFSARMPTPASEAAPPDSGTMNPPSHKPASRRSSNAGSQVTMSPPLGPQHHLAPGSHATASPSHRHMRSPSPAPLPAVRLPPSPSLGSSTASTANSIQAIAMYGDQELTPFFRRLSWSTDGSMLFTPAGIFEDPFIPASVTASNGSDVLSAPAKKRPKKIEKDGEPSQGGKVLTTYGYTRAFLGRPAIRLRGHRTGSIGIRFNPVLFQLRTDLRSKVLQAATDSAVPVAGPSAPGSSEVTTTGKPEVAQGKEPAPDSPPPVSMIDLPYRMVYAVATHDAVLVYDTQQTSPICTFSNLHYSPFSDMSWTADGRTLVMSSQDGYCTIAAFDGKDLGTPCEAQPFSQLRKSDATPPGAAAAGPPPPSVNPPLVAKRPAVSASASASATAVEAQRSAPANPLAASTSLSEPPAENPSKKRRIALTQVEQYDPANFGWRSTTKPARRPTTYTPASNTMLTRNLLALCLAGAALAQTTTMSSSAASASATSATAAATAATGIPASLSSALLMSSTSTSVGPAGTATYTSPVLPRCALECSLQVLSSGNTTCTSVANITCICTSPSYQLADYACLKANCSDANFQAALAYGQGICQQAGIAITTSATPSGYTGTQTAPGVTSTGSTSSAPSLINLQQALAIGVSGITIVFASLLLV
ncbi:uncharacterized protein L969DRAFT_53259 [Mixia osmundae IAM 14324]|uniref:CFEM domain-containing protein n=1 Tax=Mixia osmundae (strain CBS 9802 / IAM 14324 / JCM 22182 / KY 12970) TaxID=764103 RepID=G7DWI6_MIXOS|nr:uncharacterized protein L969DRAFT_53259 [Mixia osmundae IAM 14324]KEI37347.1 hypothetical protein L969DRAFT_53259 [Mixia osmundae IAM 14324]GAA94946.1 hypothetical protein E5Q_01601 [Mixia osmundae IAM 14324]